MCLRMLSLQVAVLSVALCVAFAKYKSFDGYKVFRVSPSDEQQPLLEQFNGRRGYDVWAKKRQPEVKWDIMVDPALQDEFTPFLKQHNISHGVLVPDVGRLMASERESFQTSRGGDVPFKKYLEYDAIISYLNSLAKRYSDLVTVRKIGLSFEGRDIKVIKISSGGGGNRPVILIDSGIHAREWIAPAMGLHIIKQLVENRTNSALLQRVDWHIIPLLNPDGYQFSHSMNRMWRKTRSINKEGTCRGVDANRNFDFKWGDVGASFSPCSEVYLGPEPFSERETAALRDYALDNRGRLKLYLTIHSYGGYIIYPWGYTHEKALDEDDMKSLAEEASLAHEAAGGVPLTIGTCSEVLGEIASGGSDDWMKKAAGVKFSYTIEMPGTSFAMPQEQIQRTVVPVFESIRAFGNYIAHYYG